MNEKELQDKLAKAGVEVKAGKVNKKDALKALAGLSAEEFLDKANDFRNKVVDLAKEAEKLAKEGETIKGSYQSVDFDGDVHETHNSLGEAFGITVELELVAAALHCFIANGGQISEDDEDD